MDIPPIPEVPAGAAHSSQPASARRRLALASAAVPLLSLLPGRPGVAATPEADVLAALREGGGVVLVRHARTVSGIGDPPGFDVAVCSTQRNLSDAGRTQSRRFGDWFSARGLTPTALRSSRWCRCLDTASLAFPALRAEPWDALNSTFADRASRSPAQAAQLVRAVGALAGRPGFEVWVTHMVNIQAFAGVTVSMGEALFVRPGAGAGAPPKVVAQWLPGG
jgi:phosphohistidine phosphatase SixA